MLDFWHIDPVRHQDWLLQHLKLVGAAEQERSRHLSNADHALGFLASHAALRLVLQRYGGAVGELLRSPAGKPKLPDGPQFSLSRSRGILVVAVSDTEVGTDVELVRPIGVTESACNWSPIRPRCRS